jgi:tRNA A37 threonylcarbamoyladenosine dehydratase
MRNPFTKQQQEKIRRTSIAIVGLGGTGGFILENLLRSGSENLVLFERDRFELSNFNRQILATDASLDMPKLDAAAERAKEINKSAKLRLAGEFTQDSQLEDVGIVIDGTDNVETKTAMAKTARKMKLPFVFCSANSSRGIVTVFTTCSFEKAFQIDERLDYRFCASVLCPAAAVAGSLAAAQALNVITGSPYAEAPEALFFDLHKKQPFWKEVLE